MARAQIILAYGADRDRAHAWIRAAPVNTRVDFKAPKRTTAQSDRMWAHLTDIARQRDWHGAKLSTEDWKVLFMSALNQELRIVPNLAGDGFIPLGRSSSDLSREEMADLIDFIECWCAQNGVTLNDPKTNDSGKGAGGAKHPVGAAA